MINFFLITFILIPICYSQELRFCKNISAEAIDVFKEKELATFSNKKIVAEKADHTLGALIAAKSPVVINWIKYRGLDPEKSPEIVAKEWRKYFALNFIIGKYPFGEKNLDQEVENLFTKFKAHYFTKRFRENLNKQFEETKELSIAKIKSYKLEKAMENEIVENINAVHIYIPEKLKNSKYENRLLEFFDWGVAYDPITHEINVGINELNFSNNESLKSILAHELAHSFDSCRWSSYYQGEWPFKKVGECLRGLAKPRDDSKIDEFVNIKRIPKELADSLKLNPTCNKSTYPPLGLQADQLPETFSDWFSAEVTAALAKERFREDLCTDKKLNEGSSYLSNHDRLFKVFLAHPLLQDKVGEKDQNIKYCSFN